VTNPPPCTPVEHFRIIINGLMRAVDTQRLCGLLAMSLNVLIQVRITAIRVRFYRLAEQIAAGTYKRRRPSETPRKKPTNPKPWQPSRLPTHFGWLYTLVPTENYRLSVVGPRSQLATLLQDPGMAAVMEAAPGALRRPLRSLCWMLAIKAPPLLARPRRPRRAEQAKPEPQPPRPSPRSSPRASPPRSSSHRTDPPPGVPQWLLSAPPGKKPWFPADLYDPPEPETT